MDKIKNLSVRKTILLYMAIALICSFFLSAVIVRVASRVQLHIWWNYINKEVYFDAIERNITGISRPNAYEMTQMDLFFSELCDFLQTYTILLLSITGSCVAVFLFYQHKLKKPIEELAFASKEIAENHLDFHITYKNKDEMGALCVEFERMREQLVENNRILWKNIEEEKILRVAISHDICSPLCILKGYQEMLMEYLPNADIDIEQAMEMLSESTHQIERIVAFVDTMRKMSSLENRELVAEEIFAKQLEADIQTELTILGKEYGKQFVLQVPTSEEVFYGDREIILEVMENLLSNAFRYAKCQVEVIVEVGYSKLSIYVKDDGNGFKEDAEKIVRAFHQQNVKDSLKHAGIGMYISRLYCEKHGGKLVLANEKQGGAVVTAIFCRII